MEYPLLLNRVYRIFLRYAERGVVLERGRSSLLDASGCEIGWVDSLSLSQNRLILKGQARASQVGVQYDARRYWTRTRPVASENGMRSFALDVPFESGPFDVLAVQNGEETTHPFDGFSAGRIRSAQLSLAGPFLLSLARLAPQLWRWKRGGDLGARETVKERLGLVPRSYAAELNADVLRSESAAPCPFDAVTIVMPVYNAFDLLRAALDRVEQNTDLNWRLVLIDDASTEPGLLDWLRNWADAPQRADRVQLLCNEVNQGFIKSVNRGLVVARDWAEAPVVLLNTDAMVPARWASRLLASLADTSVASVTPFSNDAEIFTMPVPCQRYGLCSGEADTLDAAAAGLGTVAGRPDAPTGVGFCMALSPRFLAQIPQFDTAFGRGYGEEADWCQKTRKLGGRHVCATDLFVEHRGGASFGSAAKQRLLERNSAELSRRYPGYDAEVQGYIHNDPLTSARLALGLSWAAIRQQGPVPVYLAHAMGGGAENYLKSRIVNDLSDGSAVVVRVGQGQRWKVELHSPHGVTEGLTDDAEVLRLLIQRLPRRRVVYSCGVGDHDAVTLPDLLLMLAGQGPNAVPGGVQPIEILLHDFFPISPSYTLLNSDGTYRGVPMPGSDFASDPAHRYLRPTGENLDLETWQTAWRKVMMGADRIVVFSRSSEDLLRTAYPEVRNIEIKPHPLPKQVSRIIPTPVRADPPVIGVLGNIGPHKGAAVLQRLSRDLANSKVAQLVVIGQLAPEFTLATPSKVHGAYRLRDLPGLIARYQISAWLIPSVWPETFSFTTHEALATGLPVFCFDLGAQADAVRAAGACGAAGAVLPLPNGDRADIAPLLQYVVASSGWNDIDSKRHRQ
jgi:O-antigen biosynthesis protein